MYQTMQRHEVKTALATTDDMVARVHSPATQKAPRNLLADSLHRRRMRNMMESAGWAGGTVMCAFLKDDDSLRFMQCEVIPAADDTTRHITVRDLELTRAAKRPVYRRVCLDTLVGVAVTYHA